MVYYKRKIIFLSFNKLIELLIMKVINFILKYKNYILFDGLINLVLFWFKYFMDFIFLDYVSIVWRIENENKIVWKFFFKESFNCNSYERIV